MWNMSAKSWIAINMSLQLFIYPEGGIWRPSWFWDTSILPTRNFACFVALPPLITIAVLPADMFTTRRRVVTMLTQPINMADGVHIRTAPFNSAGLHFHSYTDTSFLMWSIKACHRKWIHSPITILQLGWGMIVWRIILCVHISLLVRC